MNETRTVIDTSIAVSAVLLPRSVPRQAFDAAAARGKLLVSEATIAELDEVLRRPKFNRYIPEENRLEFLAALVREAEQVEITEEITACRDAKDNKFLELAISGRASHIISGDGDLLVLHPFRGIAVVTPQTFLTSLLETGA
ncbi:MAG: putative toxin-antitoxin system toxin component, PIN family [Planctomycetes bacterium]|nr:putative toxin-antitoxin system toxin component, PIN family [Planctomycetota bacterium]